MDNPASEFKDDVALPVAGAKARISWFMFFMQFTCVVAAYIIASILPAIPAIIDMVMTASQNPDAAQAQPDLGSALVASTVIASAVAGMFVAWLWLRKEGRLREAIRLE
ncbi:MAG: hypothetical protein WA957_06260, partial [Alteraurantiacibacter sp.]